MTKFNDHMRPACDAASAIPHEPATDDALTTEEVRSTWSDTSEAPADAARGPIQAPVLLAAAEAFAALGIGRTKGFELIRDGHLVARKLGSRTLVETESLRAFVAGLPRAGGDR